MEPQENDEKIDLSITEIIVSDEKTEIITEHISTEKELPPRKQSPVNIAAAILTGAAMIAIALIVVLHPANTAPSASDTQQPTTPTTIPADIATLRPSDTDHIRGDANAQILIFEYSDSDCPYCEQFHPTLEQVVNDYKGKVAWVYRYFPLDIHPNSTTEAIALQCVGQLGGAKAFNSYLDTVINVTLAPNPKSNQALTTFATQQGIDGAKFAACTADPATEATIVASSKEAQAIGAQGTPFSVIVNVKTGKQIIVPGAYPLAAVEKDIDSLLK